MRSVKGVKRGDIIRTHVQYAATQLIVSTTFAHLERASAQTGPWYRVGYELRAETGWWYAELESGDGDLGAEPATLYHRNLDHVATCPGLVFSVDFDHGVVRGVVPSSCLQDPRWVRVNPFARTWHQFPATSLDVGHRRGEVAPRIYREP
ncbi:MAG: hypothetical protein U0R80_00555 [Nocardioidaceae bacterium]